MDTVKMEGKGRPERRMPEWGAYGPKGAGRDGFSQRPGKKYTGLLILMLLLAICCAAAGENYVENGGVIPDRNTYSGSWQQAFTQVLNSHAYKIGQYEERTIDFYQGKTFISSKCRPVSLLDLTSDGIPELLFMEVSPDGNRGDFYLYSWDGSSAACRLYVPGITRLDYDDMLGFRVFCSSYGGDTFVIEHFEYEWPWMLQFTRNAFNQYTLLNYFHAEYDPSGEGDDRYTWNGRTVSYTEYDRVWKEIENGSTRLISDYFAKNYSTYGFDYTRNDALKTLQGGSSATGTGREIYGYTIDKLATRKGPSTTYEGGGTYSVKNQWIRVLAKAWDKRNGIWWVKCEIPYRKEIRVLWTGYKRFDPNSLNLADLPEEVW